MWIEAVSLPSVDQFLRYLNPLLISKDFPLGGICYFTKYLLMNMLISHIFAAFLLCMFGLHFYTDI